MRTLLTTILEICAFTLTCKAQWTTSGSNIYNSNTGNVGIGTTTPSVLLDVRGTSGTLMNLQSTNGLITDNAGLLLGSRSVVAYDGTYSGLKFATSDSSKPIVFGNNVAYGSGEYARFTGNGNLGIRVVSPSSLLAVGGNASSINGNQVSVVYLPNSLTGAYSGQTVQTIGDPATNSAAVYYGTYNESGVNYSNTADLTASVGVAGSAGMIIHRGTGNITGAAEFQAFGPYITSGGTITNAYGLHINPMKTAGVANGYGIYQTGSNDINYFGGNVGIGTSTPDQKLTVNGQVHSTSVVVTSTVPADYVFNTDYYLRPLADVKAFVDKNHHLPEVPSAAQFEKNGQNLGEMNMTLLKKIEELTLYMVEKDKEIKIIQEQNKILKKQVEQLIKAKK